MQKKKIWSKEEETKETVLMLHSHVNALAAKHALAEHIHEQNEEFF